MEQYLTPMGPTKLHVNPIFEIGPVEPRFSEWLVFEVTIPAPHLSIGDQSQAAHVLLRRLTRSAHSIDTACIPLVYVLNR